MVAKGFKNTKIGMIPEGWAIKSLNEITSEFKSGYGITSQNIYRDEKYPVYGGNGLRGFTNTFTHNGEYLLIGQGKRIIFL